MLDYLSIGSTPASEDCERADGDQNKVRAELKAFKHQLERLFPEAIFRIKTFPHDFGSYSEVCAIFDPDVEDKRTAAAYRAESETPEFWDAEAKEELRQAGYPVE